MPYPRPTLTSLRTSARSDLLSLVGALLRFSNLGVLADMLAGFTNGLYGYLDWIALQATPFTATALEIIAGWAAIKNIFQKQPQAAALQATFTGGANALIPKGTTVTRLLDGFAFTTSADAEAPAGGGAITVTIVATETGSAGNTAVGSALVLGSAVAGVGSQGTAGPASAVGADLETTPSFRARMLQAYANPAQGGSLADYLNWADAVAGVTRAWILPNGEGPGTVVVYFMMDIAEAGSGGFPQGANGVAAGESRDVAATGDQLVVANAIFAVCNVNALVYAFAPSQNQIAIEISGLSTASAAVKAAIQSAVAAVFLAKGSPGGVRMPNGGVGGQIDLDDIQAAISGVGGSSGFVIEAITASAGAASPTSNVTSNAGALPVLMPIIFS